MQWLAISIALSIVLTVVVNVVLRVFPRAGEQIERGLTDLATPRDDSGGGDGRTRVIVPWKAMIIGSLVLTLVLNLALRLF